MGPRVQRVLLAAALAVTQIAFVAYAGSGHVPLARSAAFVADAAIPGLSARALSKANAIASVEAASLADVHAAVGGRLAAKPAKEPAAASRDDGEDRAREPKRNRRVTQRYLDETRENVLENADAADALLGGLGEDPEALPIAIAGDQSIESVTPVAGWVNVFDFDGTPVYFFYVDVLIAQGGVSSNRLVEVPLVLADGVWGSSAIDLQTDGLEFVQSVEY